MQLPNNIFDNCISIQCFLLYDTQKDCYLLHISQIFSFWKTM